MSKTGKFRLMVVDDHEIVRRGLAMVLALEPDMEICGEAGDGLEAVKLAGLLDPDLILMDLKMPNLSGIEAGRQIKARSPNCKILVLTGIDADDTIFEALQSGIDGYILKEVKPEELAHAIRVVVSGQAYLHPAVTQRVLAKLSRHKPQMTSSNDSFSSIPTSPTSISITKSIPSGSHSCTEKVNSIEVPSEREREVLLGVALGQSNREIAAQLTVSEETVRTHLKSIFRKLEVSDRTQAVVVALKNGFLKL